MTLQEIPTPSPAADEVLVRVHAAAVNDWDWCFVRGRPLIYRLMFGLRAPRVKVLGAELSGVVEAVGAGVQNFRVGDHVHGDVSEAGFGGFAEYACVAERALARLPADMSFIEAASLPHAGMLAVQGLVDAGELRRGDRVLINGAGGGVGMIAAQIAKNHRVEEVTGVDSAAKLDAMRSAGFDHVIDYTRADFTGTGRQYDLIVDTKMTRWPLRVLRALRPGGRYVILGGMLRKVFAAFLVGPIVSMFTSKKIKVLILKPNRDLAEIHRLFEANTLRCIIDGPHAFSDLPAAVQRFGAGAHLGKVVIGMAAQTETGSAGVGSDQRASRLG